MEFPTIHYSFKCCWVVFFIFIEIQIEHLKANSRGPDQTPRSAASDSAASNLGLHCLPMSHKKDTRRIWVTICNQNTWHCLLFSTRSSPYLVIF